MSQIAIDVVSDIVCPWCTVGYLRLEQAASNLGIELALQWHPFELNPNMPVAGEDLYQHFHKKYGMSREKTDALGESLESYGEPLGFKFNYPRGNMMRNTFKAHQLISWAKPQGADTRLYEALFKSYFTGQQDIASTEVLLDIADSVNLNRGEAEAVLAQGKFAEAVKAEERAWLSRGIQAVPAIIFQQRYLLSGAQSIEHYEQQIRQTMDTQATTPIEVSSV